MSPEQAGWLEQGPFSDPRDLAGRLTQIVERAGPDPKALAAAARSLMVHVHWRSAYGLPLDAARAQAETNIRDLRTALAAIGALQRAQGRSEDDVSPLPLSSRLLGNCRHFSVTLAALLRTAGVPARVRCGFGSYFLDDHWEDHWVVERWDGEGWRVSDPQLDELMLERLGVDFDPMELPDGAFISGGEAWLACRAGDDPERYGIFEFRGWDFVKGNLVKDVAALAKRELLPWDGWAVMLKPHAALGTAELEALDAAARSTPMRTAAPFSQCAELAERPEFQLPTRISSWVGGPEPIEVDLGPILRP